MNLKIYIQITWSLLMVALARCVGVRYLSGSTCVGEQWTINRLSLPEYVVPLRAKWAWSHCEDRLQPLTPLRMDSVSSSGERGLHKLWLRHCCEWWK